MIEMIHGDTTIKVMPAKVDEMLRKGWQVLSHGSEVELIEEEEGDADPQGD